VRAFATAIDNHVHPTADVCRRIPETPSRRLRCTTTRTRMAASGLTGVKPAVPGQILWGSLYFTLETCSRSLACAGLPAFPIHDFLSNSLHSSNCPCTNANVSSVVCMTARTPRLGAIFQSMQCGCTWRRRPCWCSRMVWSTSAGLPISPTATCSSCR
jgi:hypothetical protein